MFEYIFVYNHIISHCLLCFIFIISFLDLKVDVHRKNSSESSDNSDVYQVKKSTSSKGRSSANNNAKQTKSSSSDNKIKLNSIVPDTVNSIEIECDASHVSKSESIDLEKSDEGLPSMKSEGPGTSIKLHNTASSRRQQYKSLKQKRSTSNIQLQQPSSSKLHRQISLDSDKIGMGSILSTDGNNYQMPKNRKQRHFSHHHHHHHHFHKSSASASTVIHPKNINDSELYLESEATGDYTTKSALQLTGDQNIISLTQSDKAQHNTPIRRDSNSTMSALQLPTLGGAPSTSGLSKSRRHSNTNHSSSNRQMPRSLTSMRRIKSAALETSCPSVSNLTPHPISVEVIDGKTIRNPENTVIPPPSKFLSRNPPLNLFPNSSAAVQSTTASSSATTISDMNLLQHVASDLVYPIAEQGDENCNRNVKTSTSCTSDDESDDEKDDDEDNLDLNAPEDMEVDEDDMTSNDGDSGLDQEEINISESDEEQNRNGSRSPLLDTKHKESTIVEKQNKHQESQKKSSKSSLDQIERDKSEVSEKVDIIEEIDNKEEDNNNNENNNSTINKSGSSDWEQTSASSKDQLIVKERSASEEKRTRWFDSIDFSFNTTAESIGEISVDKSECEQTKSNQDKTKNQKSDENRILSSSISASQISGRSLGAIPKQHGHHHRSGIAIRKLSFGEEQYPTSRMYQRTLSQRSTSDRIPENNAIQSTSTLPGLSLIRYLNNPSIEQHAMIAPQIFLPGYETQTSFSSFRPRGINESTQNHRRLRFIRSSDLNFSTSNQQPQKQQNFVIVDAKSPPSNDCDMCLDLPDGMPSTSSGNSNAGRLILASGSQQNAAFIDSSDFNCFIDEQGNWINLMNDQKAQPGHTISTNISQIQQQHLLSSAYNNNNNNSSHHNNNLSSYRHIMTAAQSAEFSALSSAQSVDIMQQRNIFIEPQIRPKVYKFPIRLCGLKLGKTIKITMNRLQLLALFDKDQYIYQILLAIVLCTLVAVLGSWVLHRGFYNDIFAFLFCFTIAGSQYSLLKSVQPDASSPIHGFNKTVTYSRPIYFCLLTTLMLICHYAAESLKEEEDLKRHFDRLDGNFTEFPSYTTQLDDSDYTRKATIYGIVIIWKDLFTSVSNFLHWMVLCLPVAFSIGLFPQINTGLMYFCEQFDMHIFGGNAVCNLVAGFLAVLRSILGCLILYGPIYGGLVESNNTQHILVSMFCGMLIPMSYHLSRSSSDFTHLFQLIKSTLLVSHSDEDICTDMENGSSKIDDNDSSEASNSSKEHNITSQSLDDPLPKKLQGTVTARLKNDLVVCTFLGLVFFILHISTIFKVLQPNLNLVLHIIAIILGLFLHYIVPQMRKHLPCLCVAAPILKSHEYGLFEVNRVSKVMWFENVYVYLNFIEKNILYPLIIISALTADATTITDKFGYGFGSALIVIASIKGMKLYSLPLILCFINAYVYIIPFYTFQH